ncbi:MAG: Clp protease N-terminal domain-containing protein [Candidatus Dormibacteria bacterium]
MADEEFPLTAEAARVIAAARVEAEAMGLEHIGTEHLLLGILSEGQSRAARLMLAGGVTLEVARRSIIDAPVRTQRILLSDLMPTSRVRTVLDHAAAAARARGDSAATIEDLVRGLLEEKGGLAVQVIEDLGVDIPRLREVLG